MHKCIIELVAPWLTHAVAVVIAQQEIFGMHVVCLIARRFVCTHLCGATLERESKLVLSRTECPLFGVPEISIFMLVYVVPTAVGQD